MRMTDEEMAVKKEMDRWKKRFAFQWYQCYCCGEWIRFEWSWFRKKRSKKQYAPKYYWEGKLCTECCKTKEEVIEEYSDPDGE